MARNDIILLDGIIEQRIADVLPSSARDEVFEYLSFEQILKDYDLSREELESGWVDGSDDGGIDGFYTLVNGHLLSYSGSFVWPKRNATLEIVIITSKHHETFKQQPLNNLLASLPELLDLRLGNNDLAGKYSEEILSARAVFHNAYRRLASVTPTLSFKFAYASRGESSGVALNIKARATQIVKVTESLFSSSKASFHFIGASELVAMYRQTKTFSLQLPFLENLSRAGDSHVLLVKLMDFCSFVTDESGQLRRYLFDSNVRDYLGENTVNEEIGGSLREVGGPEFWWLNNGVTILATGATVTGKAIQLQDVQIVNGLQTTQSVFSHFNAGNQESSDKGLLVKVVVSTDAAVRDQIIRATNNQSLVETQALHATDKIQRDIEEILERHGWFYERRKNYYRNIGKPPARFVTPMYIASGFVGLALRNPSVAGTLKSRFMRNPEAYGIVFSEEDPLEVWPAITEILKRAEDVLERLRPRGAKGERFLARTRSLLGLVVVARELGTFSYSLQNLIDLDKTALTDKLFEETWEFIRSIRPHDRLWSAHSTDYCKESASAFGLDGVSIVGQRTLPNENSKYRPINEGLINQVDRKLPPQPWPPGIHVLIGKELQVRSSMVYSAIDELVLRGRWLEQRDGILYDQDGNVVTGDSSAQDKLT